MKFLIFSLAFTFASFYSVAQSDIQIIKVKNEDRTVSISAFNHSGIVYTLMVNIDMEGMKLESPLSSSYKASPGVETHIATLIPTGQKTNFKIHCQASAMDDGENVLVDMMIPDVAIYTKNGDEKSTQIRQYLIKNDIPYNELNVSFSDKTKKTYEDMLTRRGIKKGEAKFPVIIIKGKVYHRIKDIDKFISTKF